MSNRLQFNNLGVINPLDSLSSALDGIQRSVDSTLDMYNKDAILQAKRDEMAAARAKEDRQRQNVLDDRATLEKKAIDKNLLAQKILQSPINTQLTKDVNQRYMELNAARESALAGVQSDVNTEAKKLGIDPTSPAYNQLLKSKIDEVNSVHDALLNTKNNQLVTDVKANPNVLNDAGNSGTAAILRDKLMSTGKFTLDEATSYAAQRANELSPVASKESIKSSLDSLKNVYNKQMTSLGSGNSGVSIGADGSLRVNGADKTVVSTANNPEAMAKYLSDTLNVKNNQGIRNSLWNYLFNDNTGFTTKDATNLIGYARINHVDDAQIKAALAASTSSGDGFILNTGTTNKLNPEAFLKFAKTFPTKSSRVTTKGNANTSISNDARALQAAALSKKYLESVHNVQSSGYGRAANKSDLPSFFKPEDKPSSDNTNNDDKVKHIKNSTKLGNSTNSVTTDNEDPLELNNILENASKATVANKSLSDVIEEKFKSKDTTNPENLGTIDTMFRDSSERDNKYRAHLDKLQESSKGKYEIKHIASLLKRAVRVPSTKDSVMKELHRTNPDYLALAIRNGAVSNEEMQNLLDEYNKVYNHD